MGIMFDQSVNKMRQHAPPLLMLSLWSAAGTLISFPPVLSRSIFIRTPSQQIQSQNCQVQEGDYWKEHMPSPNLVKEDAQNTVKV